MEQRKTSTTAAAEIAHGALRPDYAPDRAPPEGRIEPPAIPAEQIAEQSFVDLGLQRLPSWLSSLVFHLVALVCLALFTEVPPIKEQLSRLNVVDSDADSLGAGPQGAGDEPGEPRDGGLAPDEPPQEASSNALLQPRLLDSASLGTADADAFPPVTGRSIRLVPDAAQRPGKRVASATSIQLDLKEFGRDIMASPGVPGVPGGTGDSAGRSFASRLTSSGRADLVRSEGGTPDSEHAVALSLKWLAEHQSLDGGWNFDHTLCPKCKGKCTNPGSMTAARNAATALALLPFLGNGQTQKHGIYKKNVASGIYFLVRSMRHQAGAGSLHERAGTMYAHGLGAIVLSEAYGMTHDPALAQPAQATLNFIAKAQDPDGGGWRYHIGQRGDTSVVGWQLMALRSGQMAYLQVSPDTLRRANEFLDHVQADDGAAYGYLDSGERPATSAIGLLCRMYLGWGHDNPALGRGVQMLGDWGPSIDVSGPLQQRNNMYYNYYATQVLHHYGGYPWKKWNGVMRDYLIRTQAQSGHEQGSWSFQGNDHGTVAGGRLYCTALSCMILEVYYRHMPLYKERSTKENVPAGKGLGNGK